MSYTTGRRWALAGAAVGVGIAGLILLETVRRDAQKIAQVRPGISTEAVTGILGHPSLVRADPNADPVFRASAPGCETASVCWVYRRSFRKAVLIYYDERGTVLCIERHTIYYSVDY